MRLRVPLLVTPTTAHEDYLPLRDERGTLWRGGAAKFFADGVIDSGTAWLAEPDTHGAGTSCFWPEPQQLADAIERFARAGFDCATHAIGDAAARFVLGAYVRAGGRHRLEHLETLPDDLVHAIARAGVAASMQPIHLQYVHGNWAHRLGRERAARAFRTRDLLRAGATLALGSDWPVADADPLRGLAAAVNRLGVAPEQALTPLEALHGYTTAPARLAGEPGGMIRPGLPADLTGLAYDPVETDPEAVWLTVVAGRIVGQPVGVP
jgi:predicted amidohydrolase YtcJ